MPITLPEKSMPPRARFSGEPGQASLFDTAHPTFRQVVRWLLRGDYKGFGSRLFPMRDPEDAANELGKILDGKTPRRFDVDWLSILADHVGPDGRESLVTFWCDLLGYEKPAKKADQVRIQEEIADVRKTLEQVEAALRSVTKAVAHIEGGSR